MAEGAVVEHDAGADHGHLAQVEGVAPATDTAAQHRQADFRATQGAVLAVKGERLPVAFEGGARGQGEHPVAALPVVHAWISGKSK
ncbi:hypothetical protein FQZ97_1152220 [compost metagenome]